MSELINEIIQQKLAEIEEKEDVKILPSCSYVAKYFENHPEVSDLLVK